VQQVSCQFSVYPLGVADLGAGIDAAVAAVGRRGMSVEGDEMSSTMVDNDPPERRHAVTLRTGPRHLAEDAFIGTTITGAECSGGFDGGTFGHPGPRLGPGCVA
jgi:hypothetical protein